MDEGGGETGVVSWITARSVEGLRSGDSGGAIAVLVVYDCADWLLWGFVRVFVCMDWGRDGELTIRVKTWMTIARDVVSVR